MSEILLGIVGAVMSLAFTYVPALKAWYDAQANKGLIMLALVVLVSVAYFGLACSPLAGNFNITLACTQEGAIELVKAIFVIASGTQLAYLFTRKSAKG